MKSLRCFFIPLLLVGWLVSLSPDALSFFPGFLSPIATAPADNEDHSEDVASLDDGALQNRRLKICVSAPLVVRLKAVTFPPPTGRQSPACVLPRIWQFVLRAAAVPRAPSALV